MRFCESVSFAYNETEIEQVKSMTSFLSTHSMEASCAALRRARCWRGASSQFFSQHLPFSLQHGAASAGTTDRLLGQSRQWRVHEAEVDAIHW